MFAPSVYYLKCINALGDSSSGQGTATSYVSAIAIGIGGLPDVHGATSVPVGVLLVTNPADKILTWMPSFVSMIRL